MLIGMGLALTLPRNKGGSAPASPVQSVDASGWQAVYPSPPSSFDPVGAPVTLNVARPGFTSAGTATTVNDVVTVMARVRQPFPAQASLTANQVALSDFIYAGDGLPVGVTNNSTQQYPRPIPLWLNHDMDRARGTSFTVRLAVAHAYARAGRPVAAVKFIVSDGTNSVQQTVSAMSQRQWSSGLFAPYFEWAIPLATLNQGAICTVDVIIYPWVGTAWQASVNGATYPSINCTVLKFLNDRTGAYGEAYAYVDVAGNNATAVVSANPATAAALPFATLAAAAAAVRTFNNTTYARNDASGGTIRLNAGAHVFGGFQATTTAIIPLVIEAANPANKATTILQDNGTGGTNSLPAKVKFKDITLKKIGASITMLDNSAGLANLDRQLILENVAIDLNATASYGAWIYRTGRCWLIDVSSTSALAATFDSFSGNCKEVIAIGCSGPWAGNQIYNAVASKMTGVFTRISAGAATEAGHGQMFSHCHIIQTVNGGQAVTTTATPIDARGFALIGCVIEQTTGTTGAVIRLHADADVQSVENLLFIGNTAVGARTNYLYQDSGTVTVAKRGFMRFTVNRDRNTKSDVFGANGNLVGNWPVIYNVGSLANAVVLGSNDGNSAPGAGRWLGEVAALGDIYGSVASPLAVNYLNDQSFDGGKAGNGDYTPGAGTVLPFIPAGMAPYPVDQKGRAVPNNGTARIGAIMA